MPGTSWRSRQDFFGVATNSFLETFSIRGISTTDLGFGGDPSVAIYKDHVYQGRTGASLGQFYDMERVEVLNPHIAPSRSSSSRILLVFA